MSSSDILFERHGAAGIVTLNRPKALNALTLDMVRALAIQLDAWAGDAAVSRVVIRAAGDRAFCAGGDIRALYDLGKAGRQTEALTFFREEYALNAAIKHYPKPCVALIDGIVMGGGVGLTIHGTHRVAGDRYVFAMPEVGIGFFPDVGATYALLLLRGKVGTWCALTGDRIKTAQSAHAGAATHYVQSGRFEDLLDALCGTVPVDAILAAFAGQPAATVDADVAGRHDAIDRLFAGSRVEEILAALEGEAASGSPQAEWAAGTAATIRLKSPTSLKIALEQLRRGQHLPFDDCMALEFRIVSRIVYGHDMYEGVRAVIVDKDNAPRWQPDSLNAVTDQDVARYFAPLQDTELLLP